MSQAAVVDNYAETLLELASREEAADRYAGLMEELAAFYRNERDVRLFLDTPRVPLEEKKAALRSTFEGRAPEPFIRFLLLTLDKGRQRLIPRIAERFRELLDEREDRVHATVTLAREPDEELRETIRRELSDVADREVVPHFRVDEKVIGGVVVRMKDRVMDGSLRRRLQGLKRQLLASGEGDDAVASSPSG